jgi:hypothetical protein
MTVESHSVIILTEETEELRVKPVPLLLFPPQISQGVSDPGANNGLWW